MPTNTNNAAVFVADQLSQIGHATEAAVTSTLLKVAMRCEEPFEVKKLQATCRIGDSAAITVYWSEGASTESYSYSTSYSTPMQ